VTGEDNRNDNFQLKGKEERRYILPSTIDKEDRIAYVKEL